jgi:chromosome segregation ATPase
MAENIKTIVEEIDYKIRKLKHDYAEAVNLIKRQEEQLRTQENKIQQQKEEIEQINQKIKLIKLSKTIENKRDLTQTKLKINELVREIDNCISLLNK